MSDMNTARANALAEINTMQADLVEANAKIDQLQRALDQANDRLALVAEERKTYRDDSLLFRSKLIELATSMSNIGLLTTKAQEIMMTAVAIATPQTQEQAHTEQAEAAEIVRNLPAASEEAVGNALRGR